MKFTLRRGEVTNKESDGEQDQVNSEKEARPIRQKASQMSSLHNEERSPLDHRERRRVKSSSSKEKRDGTPKKRRDNDEDISPLVHTESRRSNSPFHRRGNALKRRDKEAGWSHRTRRTSPERKSRKTAVSQNKEGLAKHKKKSNAKARSDSPKKTRERRKRRETTPAQTPKSSKGRNKARGRGQEATPEKNRDESVDQKELGTGKGGALAKLLWGDDLVSVACEDTTGGTLEEEATFDDQHLRYLTSKESLYSLDSLVSVETPERDGCVASYDGLFTVCMDCGHGAYADIDESRSVASSFAGTERLGSVVGYYYKKRKETEVLEANAVLAATADIKKAANAEIRKAANADIKEASPQAKQEEEKIDHRGREKSETSDEIPFDWETFFSAF
jgi:hypothetical protein